jgi:uncharacterized protein with HEPN domain
MTDITRNEFKNVPVDKVRGLRNRIVHGYFTVDNRMIYEIAVMHAPPMASEAERLLTRLFPMTFERLEQRRDQESGA